MIKVVRGTVIFEGEKHIAKDPETEIVAGMDPEQEKRLVNKGTAEFVEDSGSETLDSDDDSDEEGDDQPADSDGDPATNPDDESETGDTDGGTAVDVNLTLNPDDLISNAPDTTTAPDSADKKSGRRSDAKVQKQ